MQKANLYKRYFSCFPCAFPSRAFYAELYYFLEHSREQKALPHFELLSSTGDVNRREPYFRRKPFEYAVMLGCSSCVHVALTKSKKRIKESIIDNLLLRYVSSEGLNVKTLKELIKVGGARIDSMLCVPHKNVLHRCKKCLKQGVGGDIRGETPLITCCRKPRKNSKLASCRFLAAAYLLSAGANANALSHDEAQQTNQHAMSLGAR